MRITKEKAAENRERVVEAASRLFREKGFEGVAVAELMSAAGMTHGGFYNHFGSKDDVEAAACARVFEKSVARMTAVAATPGAERGQAFAAYCAHYVSPAARDAPAASCPMAAFAGDMPRQSAAVRDAYAEGLQRYLDAFTQASGVGRAEALSQFATLVGALVLARSVAASRPELSTEILARVAEAGK